MSVKRFLKELKEEILKSELVKETQGISVPVGTIDGELLEEFRHVMLQKELIIKEVMAEVDQLSEKYKKELFKEASPIMDTGFKKVEKIHNKIWNKIYEAYGLDPDQCYSINIETGVITQQT